MAITLGKLERFLDEAGFNYKQHDDSTIVTGFSSDRDDSVTIVIRVMEDGEYLQIRTLKHLDDLVAEADAEKRDALLKWMLGKNYTTKVGAWEYDPDDHDHHFATGCPVEDGDLTSKQFMRMLAAVCQSADLIPEMKAILGLGAPVLDPVEQKRQELLAQLRALEEGTGI